MSAQSYVTRAHVKHHIPMNYLCSQCREPVTHAMKGACCHYMCERCLQQLASNLVFNCRVCNMCGTWAADPELGGTVQRLVEELLLEHCRNQLPLQLSPQLSVAFVSIGTRFLDPNILQVDLSRLTSEIENSQRCVAAAVFDTSDESFDFTRIALCKSEAELLALPNVAAILSLTLEGSWFTKMEQLKSFGSLKMLKLSSCAALVSLVGIECLTSLNHLVVEGCGVDVAWGVGRCEQLHHVEFTNCPKLTGVVLPTHRHLKDVSSEDDEEVCGVLRVTNCPLFQAVAASAISLPLQEFTARNTAFGDLTQLSSFAGLKKLDVSSKTISDISALQEASELEGVYLEGSAVLDITSLATCAPVLRKLSISGTGICDITVLQQATELEEVNVSDSQVTDTSFLPASVSMIA